VLDGSPDVLDGSGGGVVDSSSFWTVNTISLYDFVMSPSFICFKFHQAYQANDAWDLKHSCCILDGLLAYLYTQKGQVFDQISRLRL
jgi:hypothetical protein